MADGLAGQAGPILKYGAQCYVASRDTNVTGTGRLANHESCADGTPADTALANSRRIACAHRTALPIFEKQAAKFSRIFAQCRNRFVVHLPERVGDAHAVLDLPQSRAVDQLGRSPVFLLVMNVGGLFSLIVLLAGSCLSGCFSKVLDVGVGGISVFLQIFRAADAGVRRWGVLGSQTE